MSASIQPDHYVLRYNQPAPFFDVIFYSNQKSEEPYFVPINADASIPLKEGAHYIIKHAHSRDIPWSLNGCRDLLEHVKADIIFYNAILAKLQLHPALPLQILSLNLAKDLCFETEILKRIATLERPVADI